jgi:hypothetical protein
MRLTLLALTLFATQPALALTLLSDPITQAEVTHCRAFINTFPVTQPVPHLVLTSPLADDRACNFDLSALPAGRYRANAAAAILDPVTGVTRRISKRSNVVDFTVTLDTPVNFRVLLQSNPPAPAVNLKWAPALVGTR